MNETPERPPPDPSPTPTPTPMEDLRFLGATWWPWLRRPIQVASAVGITWFAISAAQVWYHRHYGPLGGFNISGMNYLDRPISSFTINNSWGGNLYAGERDGGGGSTCCIQIDRDAKTVKVRWTLDYTKAQAALGYKAETREAIVELPKITDPEKGYLGAHFLPEDKVVLTFSSWYPKPLQPIKEIHYDFSHSGSSEDE